MHAEWQVECGADDAVVVVPWSGPDSFFIDLRAHPDDIDRVPEAEGHPPLMQALRALNTSRSPVFTAKCDAWALSEAEIAQLRLDLALDAVDASGEELAGHDSEAPDSGFASYVDIICRDRALFASFARQEHLLRRVARLAAAIERPRAALECVLRPAFVSIEEAREGYAISLYVKALGESAQMAWSAWADALGDVVELLRVGGMFR